MTNGLALIVVVYKPKVEVITMTEEIRGRVIFNSAFLFLIQGFANPSLGLAALPYIFLLLLPASFLGKDRFGFFISS